MKKLRLGEGKQFTQDNIASTGPAPKAPALKLCAPVHGLLRMRNWWKTETEVSILPSLTPGPGPGPQSRFLEPSSGFAFLMSPSCGPKGCSATPHHQPTGPCGTPPPHTHTHARTHARMHTHTCGVSRSKNAPCFLPWFLPSAPSPI